MEGVSIDIISDDDVDVGFDTVEAVTTSWQDIKSSIPNYAEVAGEIMFRK